MSYEYNNPEAKATPSQIYYLIRLVGPLACFHKPAMKAMRATGVTMDQIGKAIDMAKAGENREDLRSRIEEIALEAGVEVGSPKSKPPVRKEAPSVEPGMNTQLAALLQENKELRKAAYGEGLEAPEGMTFVRGHFRNLKS
tara:strand:+ start:4826 stop:5248 length:423 start_codon:yes stop_codon:yes gene_type:complete